MGNETINDIDSKDTILTCVTNNAIMCVIKNAEQEEQL